MKYIKKFNEELTDTNIYRKAAKALKDLNHTKRASKLEKHANVMQALNKLNQLVEDIKKYKPYGIYDAGSSNGSKLKEQFELKMWFDDWSIEESFEDYENNYNTEFWLKISTGFLPILDQGDEEHIRDYYSEVSSDIYDGNVYKLEEMEDTMIGRICDYFGGDISFWGAFNGPSIYVNMSIENEKIVIKSINIDEDGGECTLDILGRRSGIQLKNLLIKLFSNEKFDFPTHNGQNLQQSIKQKICVDTGFSVKYQFAFGEIGEFIKKESINKFYNSFDFVN
jgi:hypothetical protein